MPHPKPRIRFSIELEQESDGRRICEIPIIPGVMVYGDTANQAFDAAMELASEVLAEDLREG